MKHWVALTFNSKTNIAGLIIAQMSATHIWIDKKSIKNSIQLNLSVVITLELVLAGSLLALMRHTVNHEFESQLKRTPLCGLYFLCNSTIPLYIYCGSKTTYLKTSQAQVSVSDSLSRSVWSALGSMESFKYSRYFVNETSQRSTWLSVQMRIPCHDLYGQHWDQWSHSNIQDILSTKPLKAKIGAL